MIILPFLRVGNAETYVRYMAVYTQSVCSAFSAVRTCRNKLGRALLAFTY